MHSAIRRVYDHALEPSTWRVVGMLVIIAGLCALGLWDPAVGAAWLFLGAAVLAAGIWRTFR